MNRQKQKQNETYELTPGMKYFIISILIIIVIAVLYFTFWRYMWIGQTISKGYTLTTALLFTPELASSIASLLYR